MKTKVLVTGSNGQLAKTLQTLYTNNADNIEFVFLSKEELDIANNKSVANIFSKFQFQYCINCAAYTNVEEAEDFPELAYQINRDAVKILATACSNYNVTLIHISTDYVFDGKKQTPYSETDQTNPINVYGKSKLAGEQTICKVLKEYFIIRTSWLYSKYGKNFVKTIQKLATERDCLNVINDQIGSPTQTTDLAACIYKIIQTKNKNYGIYHYSNSGKISWYDFATEIINILKLETKVIPVSSQAYPTKAQRPRFTVLNTSKIHKTLDLENTPWKQSLKNNFAD